MGTTCSMKKFYKEFVHNSFVGGFDIAYPTIPIFFGGVI